MTQVALKHCPHLLADNGNVICLDSHSFSWQLEQAIATYVDYYNQRWYHAALGSVIPADVAFGRAEHIHDQRAAVKQRTLAQRRGQHVLLASPAYHPRLYWAEYRLIKALLYFKGFDDIHGDFSLLLLWGKSRGWG